jgi:hypothetical protein
LLSARAEGQEDSDEEEPELNEAPAEKETPWAVEEDQADPGGSRDENREERADQIDFAGQGTSGDTEGE